jgi:hypothetical protein
MFESASLCAESTTEHELRFDRRVSEGTRTPDRLDHNQELYQLSYAHRAGIPIYQRVGAGTRRPGQVVSIGIGCERERGASGLDPQG